MSIDGWGAFVSTKPSQASVNADAASRTNYWQAWQAELQHTFMCPSTNARLSKLRLKRPLLFWTCVEWRANAGFDARRKGLYTHQLELSNVIGGRCQLRKPCESLRCSCWREEGQTCARRTWSVHLVHWLGRIRSTYKRSCEQARHGRNRRQPAYQSVSRDALQKGEASCTCERAHHLGNRGDWSYVKTSR
eukprot:scaffold89453_cov37-Tisochrysis_lutea.AAC.1